MIANQNVMLDSSQYPPGLSEWLRRYFNAMAMFMAGTSENGVMASGAVTTATVTSQAKLVTNPTPYRINGVVLSKAATDNLWTLTGATQAISLFGKWLLCLDVAGTASVIYCTPAATAAAVQLPTGTNLAGKSVIATLTVATDATHTFIPGTTLLGAAGITATYAQGFDGAVLPYQYGLLVGIDPVGLG